MDFEFLRNSKAIFPEHYSVEKMGRVFSGLRALLESEYEFALKLAMEYIMYAQIQERIEAANRTGEEMSALILGQREYYSEEEF